MKKFFVLLVMMALTIVNYSQAPQKMSYQAVIRNNSGQLVTNHAVGIKITILQGSSSGSVVYQETFNSLSNANGLVSIEIGGGTPVSGTFTAINWAAGTFFLRTETDPAGGTNYTISGTSQLISVPYALHAKNAASYTETDPVFGASPAKAITTGLITNWNTAYGWGNHAGLYRPVSYVPAWSEITSKPTSISGYGISDAVTITGDQTITGTKTLSNDLVVNGLTIGKGKNSVSNNTATGVNALKNITMGDKNTANGTAALFSNGSGGLNSAFGYSALAANKGGTENTAAGSNTLISNITGSYNTAMGSGALQFINGLGNTALGCFAGAFNSTGNNNIFLGYMAGFWETGSNKLIIDNQKRLNASIEKYKALIYGVFDPDPANQHLTINGSTTVSGNTSINGNAIVNGNSTVTGNLQVGSSFGPITSNWWEFGTDSNNGTGIDFHSNTSPTDYSARIFRTPGNDGEFQVVNNGSGPLVLYTSGGLRIVGLTSSSAGSPLIINSGNVYYLGSTRDIKENIRPFIDDFTKIMNVNPVSFTDKNTGSYGIGYIAEEFEEAGLQNLLVYENGKLVSLRYDLISLYNLEILKEQQKQIQNQQQQIDELKTIVSQLLAR